MTGAFFIAGPTATGKSELAADVATRVGGEIVSADAFQVYEGFDVLAGKPDPHTLGKVPHHLIGTVPVSEEMSVAKFRVLALPIIADIASRGRPALVVGGSGLYIKGLTHGLLDGPAADAQLRQELNELGIEELRARLTSIDPEAAQVVDMKNRRRIVRAIEICLARRQPLATQRTQWKGSIGGSPTIENTAGLFVFRDREELYERINKRVEAMLKNGAIDEVRDSGEVSATVEQMIGVKDIREYLAGGLSLAECIAKIQQSTRHYAKRQLTWFRRQTNLVPLNLSLLSHNEAVESILRRLSPGTQ